MEAGQCEIFTFKCFSIMDRDAIYLTLRNVIMMNREKISFAGKDGKCPFEKDFMSESCKLTPRYNNHHERCFAQSTSFDFVGVQKRPLSVKEVMEIK